MWTPSILHTFPDQGLTPSLLFQSREDAVKLVPSFYVSWRYLVSHHGQRELTSTSCRILHLAKGSPSRGFHRPTKGWPWISSLPGDISFKTPPSSSFHPGRTDQVDRPQCPGQGSSPSPRDENLVSVSWVPPVPLGEKGGFLWSN